MQYLHQVNPPVLRSSRAVADWCAQRIIHFPAALKGTVQVFVLGDLCHRLSVSQACAQGYHCRRLQTPLGAVAIGQGAPSTVQCPSDCLKAALRRPPAGAAEVSRVLPHV